jgi:energy-coupling factor transporter ATP-binding protein EcfA2
MGVLIQSFTFDRNTLKEDSLQSAKEAEAHIRLALAGGPLSKGASNIVGALRSYLGVLDQDKGLTPIGENFLQLFASNPEDAWRWLLTRSLWLYIVPNGTRANVNSDAQAAGVSFAFFREIIGVLLHLSALPGDERFLYYEELCAVLDNDANWSLSSRDLFNEVLAFRAASSASGAASPRNRILLGDLEDQYGISRDNLNTVLNKAFRQTGLFEYKHPTGVSSGRSKITGIALASSLEPVLQRRVRFIIDTPTPSYAGKVPDPAAWLDYLCSPPASFPVEVSYAPSTPEEDEEPTENIAPLVEHAVKAFGDAGLPTAEILIRRFAASLLAKRFLILTGLSGSGKTKLAQAFAQWIAPRTIIRASDTFKVGQTLGEGASTYNVTVVDDTSIEVAESGSGRRFVLPLEMIRSAASRGEEWGPVDANATSRLAISMKSDAIFDDHLIDALAGPVTAAAVAYTAAREDAVSSRHYEVIPVGADWSSRESILGYADALTEGKYVRSSPAVELILRAAADTKHPYFLILDEMNLSHVERYFADFLSVIESGEELRFFTAERGKNVLDGIPDAIKFPENLFVVGTVNVDETTYTFSPKVLDRANSIEFRVDASQMESFLNKAAHADLTPLDGRGRQFGSAFAAKAREENVKSSERQRLNAEMALLFQVLTSHGAEFGFRTAKEITRFVAFHEELTPSDWNFAEAVDAQICQKILPKLHGSRRKLEPLLCALAVLCWREHKWDAAAAGAASNQILAGLTNANDLIAEAERASRLEDDHLHPLTPNFPEKQGQSAVSDGSSAPSGPEYPISFDKIRRMLSRLTADGFVSFAEA